MILVSLPETALREARGRIRAVFPVKSSVEVITAIFRDLRGLSR
jgi:hypothetical protein